MHACTHTRIKTYASPSSNIKYPKKKHFIYTTDYTVWTATKTFEHISSHQTCIAGLFTFFAIVVLQIFFSIRFPCNTILCCTFYYPFFYPQCCIMHKQRHRHTRTHSHTHYGTCAAHGYKFNLQECKQRNFKRCKKCFNQTGWRWNQNML